MRHSHFALPSAYLKKGSDLVAVYLLRASMSVRVYFFIGLSLGLGGCYLSYDDFNYCKKSILHLVLLEKRVNFSANYPV